MPKEESVAGRRRLVLLGPSAEVSARFRSVRPNAAEVEDRAPTSTPPNQKLYTLVQEVLDGIRKNIHPLR